MASPGLSPLTEECELDSLVFDTEKECLSLIRLNKNKNFSILIFVSVSP